MTSKEHVAFIGLGAMGFGMATNLVKSGYPVTGFDLNSQTLNKFEAAGGCPASTPAEAVLHKNVCVIMVATAQQAQAVIFEGKESVISALPKGAILLLCSTVPCSYAQGLEEELKSIGRSDVLLVDCPVSGGAARAADGTLSIMAGASDKAIDRAKELLSVMSAPEKLYIVKGGIGAGSNLKMCHQVLAANQILSASEALGLARRMGLDLNEVSSEIVKSEGWSWMLENRLPRILDAKHQPIASALTIILKDTSIITKEARRYGFPTPMTSAAEQVYFTGLTRGYGPDDDGGLIRLYTDGADLVGPVSGSASSKEEKIDLVIKLLKGIHLCSAAETLAFAARVGLDLQQVMDVCLNAAGSSKILSSLGQALIKRIEYHSSASGSVEGPAAEATLADFATGLSAAVAEAQSLKLPLFLGNTALGLLCVGSRKNGIPAATIVNLWQ